MASRRQVRQAAVQFLYARDATPESVAGSEFWTLVNDHAGINYDRARVKILGHLQQGREAAAAALQKMIVDQAAAILAVEPNGKLARVAKSCVEAEVAWAEQCGNLIRLTKANTGGWRRDLDHLLPKSDELRSQRTEIRHRLEPLPPAVGGPLFKILDRLDRYDDRVRMVRFPEQYPGQRELERLHRLAHEMKDLAAEALELGTKVEESREEIDAAIAASSTNFDLKRLAKVDLAILRLATWEILKRADLDAAISITEAVDLARSFADEESAAFVNGVLDDIARSRKVVSGDCKKP